ncbi:MAG: voltage-gated potassium channel [bacterium]|jgi:voltage-gated potassium channel
MPTESQSPFKQKLYEIIFGADTPAGKAFDLALIIVILISVVAVMLESIKPIREEFGFYLRALEWILTILFTIEYLVRIYCVRKPLGYIFSFYGVIDLLATIPTYLSLLFPGSQFLIVVRLVRTLRTFRILKLAHYIDEGSILSSSLIASRRKIAIFLCVVLTLVTILGSLMYVIEDEQHGFTSIPQSIYWAIVTLTTVGYGDISPHTPLGQLVASFVMLLGYVILAVPTGIVTVELSKHVSKQISTQVCPDCSKKGHDTDANYCKYCSGKLD